MDQTVGLDLEVIISPGNWFEVQSGTIELTISRLRVSAQRNEETAKWSWSDQDRQAPYDLAEKVKEGSVTFEDMIVYAYSRLVNKPLVVEVSTLAGARYQTQAICYPKVEDIVAPPEGMLLDPDRPNPIAAIGNELTEIIASLLRRQKLDGTPHLSEAAFFSPAHWERGPMRETFSVDEVKEDLDREGSLSLKASSDLPASLRYGDVVTLTGQGSLEFDKATGVLLNAQWNVSIESDEGELGRKTARIARLIILKR